MSFGEVAFFWVRTAGTYFVAATRANAHATLVFEFLHRLIALCKTYMGELGDVSIKQNFMLIYELLDELLDFGYPQTSDASALHMYITAEGVAINEAKREDSRIITRQTTGPISWRRTGIKYRKNECYLDVIETINLLISAQGTVLRADVDGRVQMRAYLSGMPECFVGLNTDMHTGPALGAHSGSVNAEDCSFHQCVQLEQLAQDHSIYFVPPDGEFELLRYRATKNVRLPFRVNVLVNEDSRRRLCLQIVLRATMESRLMATQVVVRIPTPRHASDAQCSASLGRAKFEPALNQVAWRLPKVTGHTECTLCASIELAPTVQGQVWSRPPIELDFQVLMFAASGFAVRYLKVQERSLEYESHKWVRYTTRASGSYLVRY